MAPVNNENKWHVVIIALHTADEYVMRDVTERVSARAAHLARIIAAVF